MNLKTSKSARAGEVRQIKAELRDIKRTRQTIQRTHGRWMAEKNRVIARLNLHFQRGTKAVARSHAKIDRRCAILEGRLS